MAQRASTGGRAWDEPLVDDDDAADVDLLRFIRSGYFVSEQSIWSFESKARTFSRGLVVMEAVLFPLPVI